MAKMLGMNEKVVPDGMPPPTAASGNGGAVMPPPTVVSSASEPPPDPFDPERLRLSQNFLATGGVKQHITSVPARKPSKEEWFMLNSAPEYTMDTLVLELKDSGETYLIAPELHATLITEPTVTVRRIFVGINRQGSVFVWAAKLPPAEGRRDSWAESALAAAHTAMKTWVRMQADMGIGSYVHYTSTGELPPPNWPDLDLRQLLKLAFRNNIIDSMDHIVLRRLRGEV